MIFYFHSERVNPNRQRSYGGAYDAGGAYSSFRMPSASSASSYSSSSFISQDRKFGLGPRSSYSSMPSSQPIGGNYRKMMSSQPQSQPFSFGGGGVNTGFSSALSLHRGGPSIAAGMAPGGRPGPSRPPDVAYHASLGTGGSYQQRRSSASVPETTRTGRFAYKQEGGGEHEDEVSKILNAMQPQPPRQGVGVVDTKPSPSALGLASFQASSNASLAAFRGLGTSSSNSNSHGGGGGTQRPVKREVEEDVVVVDDTDDDKKKHTTVQRKSKARKR
jgi:hypothetical protein